MASDEEGFLYPEVDSEKCTDCGLCDKVCPEINVAKETPIKQNAFLLQHKDERIRKESTSGGAFSAIGEYVIKQGGVVFGVAYSKDFEVIHKHVESVEELKIFRNSKYVQSRIGETYQQALDFLKKGRLVCYSGTPCQIEGLKQFLRKDYSNLFTVDVVCRAVPSPLVLRKYLELQKVNLSNISNICFRDKCFYGYKYSMMSIYDNSYLPLYHNGVETDVFLRAFFSNICDRPSCYSCSFKKRYRVSDLTLWDCFTVDKFDKNLDDDKGTTRILAHTDKARQLLEKIAQESTITEIDTECAIEGVREIFESVPLNQRRVEFFHDINRLDASDFFQKYFPNNLRARLEKQARLLSYKFGIYKQMKAIVKMFYKNGNNQKV